MFGYYLVLLRKETYKQYVVLDHKDQISK